MELSIVKRWRWFSPLFWLLVTLGCLVFAVQREEVDLLQVSAIPAALAATGLLVNLNREVGVFRADEFVLPSGNRLPFSDLRAVTTSHLNPLSPAAEHRRFTIQFLIGDTTVTIPPKINIPSQKIAKFLFAKLPPPSESILPPALVSYRNEQVAKFGKERVFALGPSVMQLRRPWNFFEKNLLGFVFGVFGLLFLACIVPNKKGSVDVSYGAGALVGIIAFYYLIGYALFLKPYLPRNILSRPRGLVISPLGIALVQGEVVGELRWDEVKNLRLDRLFLGGMPSGRVMSPTHAILIGVTGSSITVYDVFERPVFKIFEKLQAYWKPPAAPFEPMSATRAR